jgi:hypothetical protein
VAQKLGVHRAQNNRPNVAATPFAGDGRGSLRILGRKSDRGEGICRASARQRWSVDLATPSCFATLAMDMLLTDSSFSSGTGSEGRQRRLPRARARSSPAVVRSLTRLGFVSLTPAFATWGFVRIPMPPSLPSCPPKGCGRSGSWKRAECHGSQMAVRWQ